MKKIIIPGLIVAAISAFVFTPLSDSWFKEESGQKIPNPEVAINNISKPAKEEKQDTTTNIQRDEYFFSTNEISEIEKGKIFFYVGVPVYNQWDSFQSVDIEISSPGQKKVPFKKQSVGSILKYQDYEFRFMEYKNHYLKIKVSRLNKSSKSDAENELLIEALSQKNK